MHFELDKNKETWQEEQEKKSAYFRRSTKEKKSPMHYDDEFASFTTAKHTALYVTQVEKPAILNRAHESEHAKLWKAAADSEYQSLIEIIPRSW